MSREWVQACGLRGKPIPWVTGAVVVSALVISATGSEAWFIFDRGRVSAGEFWRLWTGNLVHFGWIHAAADIGLLAVLGWLLESERRSLMAASLVVLPAGVTLAVLWFDPRLSTYAGLSGLNFGWLVLLALRGWRRSWTDWFWPVVLFLYAAELVGEARFGHGMIRFSDPNVVIATSAHIGGGLAAVVLWLAADVFDRKGRSARRTRHGPALADPSRAGRRQSDARGLTLR